MKKAQRHYEPWSLQEAREFVIHCLDGVKYSLCNFNKKKTIYFKSASTIK
jgi:hypothetical protein